MNYSISLSGQSYTLSTSDDAQIAAIAACRAKYNESLPQTISGDPVDNGDGTQTVPQVANPALIATDAAYLEFVFTAWAAGNPGFTQADLEAAFASAAASYAGQNPPQQVVEQVALTGDALKAALKAYASEKRWKVETGGITLNGVRVPTDDRAKLLLLGAASCMPDGSSSPFVVNGVNHGTFTKAQFVAINAAVIAHVQATYPILASVLSDIEAGTITSIDQINAANWS